MAGRHATGRFAIENPGRHDSPVRFNCRRRNILARTIFGEKFEERRVPQLFFQISALVQIFRVDFRHRQTVAAKMPGEFEKSDVLFAHIVQNADGGDFVAGQPDNLPPRTTQIAL